MLYRRFTLRSPQYMGIPWECIRDIGANAGRRCRQPTSIEDGFRAHRFLKISPVSIAEQFLGEHTSKSVIFGLTPLWR